MGCSSVVKKPKVAEPIQATDQEARIMAKIRELGLQFEGVGSNAELELIHQTFLGLHDMDSGRRNVWLQALHNDILAPLYFSKLDNFKYSQNNPFVPNQNLLNQLRDKDFDTIIKPKDELRECLLHVFYDHITLFNIDIVKMQRLILAISENYQSMSESTFKAFYVRKHIFFIELVLSWAMVKKAKVKIKQEPKTRRPTNIVLMPTVFVSPVWALTNITLKTAMLKFQ